jgi:uncharacterized protein (DUF305 family)
MVFPLRPLSGLLFLGVSTLCGQQNSAPIVQPGAPGQRSKTLSPKSVHTAPRPPLDVDVAFMQGMIHHHAQAVEMVELLRTRAESPTLKAFGEKIAVSQTDEIQFMKNWLGDRGKPSSMSHAGMTHAEMGHIRIDHAGAMDQMNMTGMDHGAKTATQLDSMADMPAMPGMLTPEQMKTLAAAKGAEFDRFFLTGMIQHHTGALTMVDDLFRNPAAAQDSVLYDFATDITNTQSAEIEIMKKMLEQQRK